MKSPIVLCALMASMLLLGAACTSDPTEDGGAATSSPLRASTDRTVIESAPTDPEEPPPSSTAGDFPVDLAGVDWLLTGLWDRFGRPIDIPEGTNITLRFDAAQVTGIGCEPFAFPVTYGASSLTVDVGVLARGGCATPDGVTIPEPALLEALRATRSAAAIDGIVTLYDSDGRSLATLAR